MEGQVLGAVIGFGTANLAALASIPVLLTRRNGKKSIKELREDCPYGPEICAMKKSMESIEHKVTDIQIKIGK